MEQRGRLVGSSWSCNRTGGVLVSERELHNCSSSLEYSGYFLPFVSSFSIKMGALCSAPS